MANNQCLDDDANGGNGGATYCERNPTAATCGGSGGTVTDPGEVVRLGYTPTCAGIACLGYTPDCFIQCAPDPIPEKVCITYASPGVCLVYFDPNLVDWDKVALDVIGLVIDLSVIAGGVAAPIDVMYSGFRFAISLSENDSPTEKVIAFFGIIPVLGLGPDIIGLLSNLAPGIVYE